MINDIEPINMPDWLTKNNFTFNVNEVLENSLYYPSSGFDGDPIAYLTGNIFSFVYVDYGYTKEDLIEDINKGVAGYKIIHQQSLSQSDLSPNGLTVKIPLMNNDGDPNRFFDFIKKPFCEWFIFEKKTSKYCPRFSLIYLCADGVAAYQSLYLSNNIKPKIITIKQPGYGIGGGNWTDFRDRIKIFARSVFYDDKLLPDYIINGGYSGSYDTKSYDEHIWDEFNESICKYMTMDRKFRYSAMVIWKRTKNI